MKKLMMSAILIASLNTSLNAAAETNNSGGDKNNLKIVHREVHMMPESKTLDELANGFADKNKSDKWNFVATYEIRDNWYEVDIASTHTDKIRKIHLKKKGDKIIITYMVTE